MKVRCIVIDVINIFMYPIVLLIVVLCAFSIIPFYRLRRKRFYIRFRHLVPLKLVNYCLVFDNTHFAHFDSCVKYRKDISYIEVTI